MLKKIQTRLEIKILLLIVLVLLVGFGTYVIITIQNESRALMERQQQTLRASSAALMAGIRNVMLTGKAPYAVEMVNDVRQNVRFVDVTIFDRFGREVFLREGEGMNPNVNDTTVSAVLASRTLHSAMMNAGKELVLTRYVPLVNTAECWRCHPSGDPLRGVIQVALKPSATRTMMAEDPVQEMARTMGTTIATAFRTIMLGGNGEQMDTLMAKARSIPGVDIVQVYGRDGFLQFGPEENEVPDSKIRGLTSKVTTDVRFEHVAGKLRLFIPLVNEERCQVCHGAKFPMRGVMVIDFKTSELKKFAEHPEQSFTAALQAAVTEGFRSIMLVGRANSVRFYMDELRTQPAYQTLRVFDRNGVERFLNPPPRTLPTPNVVEKMDTVEYTAGINGEPTLVRTVPILNEKRCFACHSSKQKVRGVVEVTASLAEIHHEIQLNQIRSVGVAIITLLLVWLVIRYFMRTVVVKPVQMIERVASRVGQGDFSARAHVDSRDEIGNLAKGINDMVTGLRERFHLEKFVSQQTVNAVRRANGAVKLGGQRISATVFFSDIRGFTAYSERVSPERVVSMLNGCLSTQAAIIQRYGGDIDNYVGDEVFALFEGERMVERAVLAAIEIQDQVLQVMNTEDHEAIDIGIGINTGEMVMGAMGSEERMALTVIGDSVNLGARLCSVAKGKQILISEASAMRLETNHRFTLVPLEPIQVKGKREPIKIFAVKPN